MGAFPHWSLRVYQLALEQAAGIHFGDARCAAGSLDGG